MHARPTLSPASAFTSDNESDNTISTNQQSVPLHAGNPTTKDDVLEHVEPESVAHPPLYFSDEMDVAGEMVVGSADYDIPIAT